MKLIDYLKQKKRDREYRTMQRLMSKYIPKDIRLSTNPCEVVKLCVKRQYSTPTEHGFNITNKDTVMRELFEGLRPYIKLKTEESYPPGKYNLIASIEIVKR